MVLGGVPSFGEVSGGYFGVGGSCIIGVYLFFVFVRMCFW